MTGYYLAGGWLILVAAVICFFAGRSRLERNARADEFAAQRTPGMGDLSTVPETQIVHEHRQRLAESDEHPVIASARTRPYLASVLARRELENDEALAERLREWGQES